jgi:hypothetical protein
MVAVMGEHVSKSSEHLSISCDDPGCGAELPVRGNFGVRLTPAPHTCRTANGKNGDERGYHCEDHSPA